jgi:hypothetical protein
MLAEALLDRDLRGQSHRASSTPRASAAGAHADTGADRTGKSLYSAKTWLDKLDLTYELKGHRGCVNTLSYVLRCRDCV